MEANLGRFTIELTAPPYEAIKPQEPMTYVRRDKPTQQEMYASMMRQYIKREAKRQYERYVNDVITRAIQRIKKELGKEIGEEVKKEAVANLDKVVKATLK